MSGFFSRMIADAGFGPAPVQTSNPPEPEPTPSMLGAGSEDGGPLAAELPERGSDRGDRGRATAPSFEPHEAHREFERESSPRPVVPIARMHTEPDARGSVNEVRALDPGVRVTDGPAPRSPPLVDERRPFDPRPAARSVFAIDGPAATSHAGQRTDGSRPQPDSPSRSLDAGQSESSGGREVMRTPHSMRAIDSAVWRTLTDISVASIARAVPAGGEPSAMFGDGSARDERTLASIVRTELNAARERDVRPAQPLLPEPLQSPDRVAWPSSQSPDQPFAARAAEAPPRVARPLPLAPQQPAVRDEPAVQIDQIDVYVAAPAVAEPHASAPSPAAGYVSRMYLRRL